MKKTSPLSFLLLVAVLTAMASGPVFGAEQNGSLVPGQFIVVVKDGVSPAKLAERHGAVPRHVFEVAINGFTGALSPGQVDALRNHPDVLTVEQERIFRIDVQPLPTGIDRIEGDKNPNANGVTVDVDVAILDSGIDMDHPDLNIAGGINFSFGGAGAWDDGNGPGPTSPVR
jgi:subtilisin family serine protease